MAAPTITSVTPSTGPGRGGTLVEIIGTNFVPQVVLPGPGVSSPLKNTAQVLFGTVDSIIPPAVVSATRIIVRAPAADIGAVGVTVNNLDAFEVPIPGETVTLAGGYTYIRPPLLAESALTYVIRSFIKELKRQTISEVVYSFGQTDFADPAGALVQLKIASLPAIALMGPRMPQNRFYSLNQLPEEQDNEDPLLATSFVQRREPLTVNLEFTIVGMADTPTETLNLSNVVGLFFHRNKFFSVLRDPGDPSKGKARYELDWVTNARSLDFAGTPNESNIGSFTGTVHIIGFDLDELAGIVDDAVILKGTPIDEDGIILELEQKT